MIRPEEYYTWFGVPHTLISDNGLQFDSKAFRRYYCDLGIKNRYSILAYPQGNRQADAVNKIIVSALKKRLDNAKGRWMEELSHVLWTYQTTPHRSTAETPFSMTYGAEAIIPLEIGFPTLRTSSFTPSNNDGLLEKSLDLIEERRESVMVQLAYYQHKLKQEYDANVRLRPLTVGDLVLRKVLGTAKNPAWGKLRPNWEGHIISHRWLEQVLIIQKIQMKKLYYVLRMYIILEDIIINEGFLHPI